MSNKATARLRDPALAAEVNSHYLASTFLTSIPTKIHVILILTRIFQLLRNRHLIEHQEFDVAIVDLLYNECGLALARDGISITLHIPLIFSTAVSLTTKLD